MGWPENWAKDVLFLGKRSYIGSFMSYRGDMCIYLKINICTSNVHSILKANNYFSKHLLYTIYIYKQNEHRKGQMIHNDILLPKKFLSKSWAWNMNDESFPLGAMFVFKTDRRSFP